MITEIYDVFVKLRVARECKWVATTIVDKTYNRGSVEVVGILFKIDILLILLVSH